MRAITVGFLAAAAAFGLALADVSKAESALVDRVLASEAYRSAVAALKADHERVIQEIIELTEIPAPPFGERERAAAYLKMLRDSGLSDVEIDAEGNAMGLRRGVRPAGKPLLVIAAHLDTVFPKEVDVKVRRDGSRLYAPGVGDDTRSLAVLLAFARAMDVAGVKTASDILFVGNVGEEGPGDLRGVRHLFATSRYKDRVKYFISMDSTDAARVVNEAVGSRRYRVTFKGPGGHSYGAFGLVNPMVALSHAIAALYDTKVAEQPKTTYAASVVGGGTSVNSIPHEVYAEFDMRSSDARALTQLERRLMEIVAAAVESENTTRSTIEGRISAEPKLIGDRPAGTTPANSHLVQVAVQAIAAQGLEPVLTASSTDANVPMSLGIPAITIGSGGSGGRAHSLDEWIDVEPVSSVRGMSVGLTMLLALAELQ